MFHLHNANTVYLPKYYSSLVDPRPSYWVNNKYVRSHTIIGIVLRLFWCMHLGQNRHRNFAVVDINDKTKISDWLSQQYLQSDGRTPKKQAQILKEVPSSVLPDKCAIPWRILLGEEQPVAVVGQ